MRFRSSNFLQRFVFRADLPFERDGSDRFLPWIIAIMVFLAAAAMAGAFILGNSISEWETELSGHLTVQIPHSDSLGGDDLRDDVLDKILEILRETEGVASADLLDREDMTKLLEPWLGTFANEDGLPLPYLIDVTLHENATLNTAALAAQLRKYTPDVAVDDHRVWLADFIDLARTIQFVAFAVVGLVGITSILAVAFVTRSGITMHHQVIEMLHQMGAQDAYVARQFQAHTFFLAARGALAGGGITILTLMVIAHAAHDLEAAFLPSVGLTPWNWGALATVPVFATVIAVLTARLTVLKYLARIP